MVVEVDLQRQRSRLPNRVDKQPVPSKLGKRQAREQVILSLPVIFLYSVPLLLPTCTLILYDTVLENWGERPPHQKQSSRSKVRGNILESTLFASFLKGVQKA